MAKFSDYRFKNDWIDQGRKFPVDADGGYLQVRRWGNKDFQKLLKKLTKPYLHIIRNGSLPEDTDREIMIKIVASTVLVGWGGFVDDIGKEVPYSIERASAELSEDGFYQTVCELSQEDDLFRDTMSDSEIEEVITESEKN